MPSTKCMADACIDNVSSSIARDERLLSSLKVPFSPSGVGETARIPTVIDSPAAIASELQESVKLAAAKQAERIAAEDTASQLGSKITELGEKLAAAPKSEKAAIKAQLDGVKAQASAATSRVKRLAQESWEAQRAATTRGSQLVDGRTSYDDLMNTLQSTSVREGKEAVDEALAKSDSLKEVLRNTSREEAEAMASQVSEALGSDRTYAQKLMNYHYQGAAQRIDPTTLSKMTKSDQELIAKARLNQLSPNDYQQLTRILDNSNAYSGVSVGADLGRVKVNSVLDSSMADKAGELKKLLSDQDVKTALRDETFAEETFAKVYDINPDVATQFQKATQDNILSDIRASPEYAKLSKKNKEFVDTLYTKRSYTAEDINRLAEIRDTLGLSTFQKLIRGTVTGAGGFLKNAASSPLSAGKSLLKGTFKAWVIANGIMFVYFAAEEGVQTIIQMTGWNTPLDQYMEFMDSQGIPAMERVEEILGPLDWIMENVPFASVLFPAAAGFKWYNDEAMPSILKDKLQKGINGGLWVPGTGCEFGPGCYGSLRPESERPAYWAAHPDTIGFLDGDLVRRIYDMQPDGTVGPNNLIAQGLGITDPAQAVQVGMGHMIAAGNMGAKETLTKEFTNAYDMLVKGGAKSELAQQAYVAALASSGTTSPTAALDPATTYILADGTTALGSAITNPASVVGQLNPDGSVTPIGVPSTRGTAPIGTLTPDQQAALAVAPTKAEALARYATFGGTQPTDAQAWRSIFVNSDGVLDIAKLKSVYPDMTSAEIQSLFPDEAINKAVKADIQSVGGDPAAVAAKLNQYKAEGLINENARVEQYLNPADAAAFNAKQNDPSKFKLSVVGGKATWVDDTGYPHTEEVVKSSKLLNPATGQYDIDQKRTEADGSEYTIDTGKYAAWVNTGGTDLAGFLANPENWIQTWKGSGSSSKSSSSKSSGSSSKKSSGSSYSKTTGQTGIFIDAAGISAEVWENGEKIGLTDVIIDVEAGVHTVTIKKSGYKSYTIPVQVYSGSIARKSVTLYTDTTTQTQAQKFITAIGGENALNPDHIMFAYATLKNNTALAANAKASAVPTISGSWSFTVTDVKALITAYGGA